MSAPDIPFPKFGSGPGLKRTLAAAHAMGLDPAAIGARSIAVAGSNGKGGTTAFAAAILSRAVGRVARFTSPHLYRINERFALDGEPISDADLARHGARAEAAMRAHEAARPGVRFGGFEYLFLTALSWMDEIRPRFAVFECGIGGRHDPTRLLKAPTAALVSLDLEHTALLGDTLIEIARDKLDVCPSGGRVWLGETAAPLRAEIEAYCGPREVQTTFLESGRDWRVSRADAAGVDLDLRIPGDVWIGAHLPLAGRFQANNAAIAAHMAFAVLSRKIWSHQVHYEGVVEAISTGLAGAVWPGRLEVIHRDPLVVIDVGHTPDGVARALQGFREAHGDGGVLVTGVSADKDAEGILGILAPAFATVISTAARHKGRAADDLAAIVRRLNPAAEVLTAPDPAAAWALARGMRGPVYVAGGLFLAAEFATAVRGEDPAGLVFF